MNLKLVRIISATTAFLGMFLTFCDKYWADVAKLSPNLAHSGPIIIGAAALFHHFLMMFTDTFKSNPPQ